MKRPTTTGSTSLVPASSTGGPSALLTVDESEEPRRKRASTSHGDLQFPYSRDLMGHYGCVNALAYSRDGRWLASGGDDKRVLLWDLFGDLSTLEPTAAWKETRANIFSIDFAEDKRNLFSAGLCSSLYCYDIETATNLKVNGYSNVSWINHLSDGPIRRVSCHPTEPTTVLTASEEGSITLHDTRDRELGSKVILGTTRTEFTDVRWSPASPHLFATSTTGTLFLRDRRYVRRASENLGIVKEFATSLIKSTRVSAPEISSITFNTSGTLLAAIMSQWSPTIWEVETGRPVALLKGDAFEQGGYQDNCTIKHGSFSHSSITNATYFAAGSDDFRAYVWKLPELSVLKETQQVIDSKDWPKLSDETPEMIAWPDHTAAAQKIVPAAIQPAFRLAGHRSIPNTALFHPYFPLLLTSGVEKIIKLHSSHSFGTSVDCLTPADVRPPFEAVPGPRVLGLEVFEDDGSESDEEERTNADAMAESRRTLTLFDSLVRNRGGARAVLNWYSDSDSSDEEEGDPSEEEDHGDEWDEYWGDSGPREDSEEHEGEASQQ